MTGMTYSAGGNQLGNLTYTYDADGHVVSKGGTMASTGLPTAVSGNTFNAANAMTAFGGQSLTYDANGNLTSDGTNSYGWDARNHLIAIGGANLATFVYDALGRRASKTINGVTTQFLYDGRNPVQELDGSSPPNVTANLLTGLRIDEYFSRTDAAGAMSLLSDALGSTLALTDATGSVNTAYTYEPFGNVAISGTNANPYQFTGRENDGTGLYYYRARYYSPTFQRFIAQDPLGLAGVTPNFYTYVLNNPLTLIDPLGLLTEEEIGNIIFNETRSMSGSDIFDARIDMGHVLINGSDEVNPPAHAPDTVPFDLNPQEARTLDQCQAAAQQAQNQAAQGVDPTNGATHYNNRVTNSDVFNPNLNDWPTMILGPFDNTYNDYHYIDIYQ